MKLPKYVSPKTALATMGGYAAICAVLYFKQQKILYQPAKLSKDTPAAAPVLPQSEEGPQLMGWVDNPGQSKALVYYGGVSEAVELRREALAKAFPDHTRYVVPYRGFGPNALLPPDEAALKSDALRLARYAQEHHDDLHLIGRSLGSGMAIHVAARMPVKAVGLITPYDSILEVAKKTYRWLPIAHLLKDRFESWRDAGNVTAPILVCLAEVDKVVPVQRTDALCKHMAQSPQRCLIPQSNHRTIADFDGLWNNLAAFFSQSPALVTDATPARPRLSR